MDLSGSPSLPAPLTPSHLRALQKAKALLTQHFRVEELLPLCGDWIDEVTLLTASHLQSNAARARYFVKAFRDTDDYSEFIHALRLKCATYHHLLHTLEDLGELDVDLVHMESGCADTKTSISEFEVLDGSSTFSMCSSKPVRPTADEFPETEQMIQKMMAENINLQGVVDMQKELIAKQRQSLHDQTQNLVQMALQTDQLKEENEHLKRMIARLEPTQQTPMAVSQQTSPSVFSPLFDSPVMTVDFSTFQVQWSCLLSSSGKLCGPLVALPPEVVAINANNQLAVPTHLCLTLSRQSAQAQEVTCLAHLALSPGVSPSQPLKHRRVRFTFHVTVFCGVSNDARDASFVMDILPSELYLGAPGSQIFALPVEICRSAVAPRVHLRMLDFTLG